TRKTASGIGPRILNDQPWSASLRVTARLGIPQAHRPVRLPPDGASDRLSQYQRSRVIATARRRDSAPRATRLILVESGARVSDPGPTGRLASVPIRRSQSTPCRSLCLFALTPPPESYGEAGGSLYQPIRKDLWE